MNTLDFINKMKENIENGKKTDKKNIGGFLVVDEHVLLETGWHEIDFFGINTTIERYGTTEDKLLWNKTKNSKQIPVSQKEKTVAKKSRSLDFRKYKKNKKNKSNKRNVALLNQLKRSGIFTLRLTKTQLKKQTLVFFEGKKGALTKNVIYIFIEEKYIKDIDNQISSSKMSINKKGDIDYWVKSILEIKEIPETIKRQIEENEKIHGIKE